MKFITSTLYNWLSDTDCSRSQLHIYAIKNEEEWNRIDDIISCGDNQIILEELGYYSDTVPIESIPGHEYIHYDCHLMGDFLVVVETVTLDV